MKLTVQRQLRGSIVAIPTIHVLHTNDAAAEMSLFGCSQTEKLTQSIQHQLGSSARNR